ncbi:tautomerase family protein [Streptomyces sp. RTd22]|uniref:tautomerase family protein n=1 Tax=Streptomyces sp. RTd22 TaxID=1841249 RepID=UPI0018FEFF38|nr:tautomerase family protein [Streptomyces sp. RTd22]
MPALPGRYTGPRAGGSPAARRGGRLGKKTLAPLIQITQDDVVPPGAEAGIIEAVTRAYAAASSKDPSRIWVTITQLPGTHWGVGGTPLSEDAGRHT